VLGLPGALHGRDLAGLVVSPLPEPAANVTSVRQWAQSRGRSPQVAGPELGGELGADGYRVRWHVLTPLVAAGDEAGPGVATPQERDGGDGSVVNESSVAAVMEVSGPTGSLRLVGLGDLEIPMQQRLEAALRDQPGELGGPVDVVKVAHHGSAKQDPGLYRLLDAPVALIGVGEANDYGHPAASALTMLADAGATALRTDRGGGLAVIRDAGAMEVMAERDGS
jgi:competence protein ComEC